MSVIEKLLERIRQKGLGRTLGTLWKRYVFFHWELLWMERDLITPVPPHTLRPYDGLRKVDITAQNAEAFGKHFGDRVQTMAELAAEVTPGTCTWTPTGTPWRSSGAAFATITTATITAATSRSNPASSSSSAAK